MAGTPAPRQAARLRGPRRPAPLAAASEKLLEGQRPRCAGGDSDPTSALGSRLAAALSSPTKRRFGLSSSVLALGPQPNAKPLASQRFVVYRLRGQPRASAVAKPNHAGVCSQGALSAAGRQHGAGERFFRALRPGLRREYPPLKLTHYQTRPRLDIMRHIMRQWPTGRHHDEQVQAEHDLASRVSRRHGHGADRHDSRPVLARPGSR